MVVVADLAVSVDAVAVEAPDPVDLEADHAARVATAMAAIVRAAEIIVRVETVAHGMASSIITRAALHPLKIRGHPSIVAVRETTRTTIRTAVQGRISVLSDNRTPLPRSTMSVSFPLWLKSIVLGRSRFLKLQFW